MKSLLSLSGASLLSPVVRVEESICPFCNLKESKDGCELSELRTSECD